jgi:hypothetical protein
LYVTERKGEGGRGREREGRAIVVCKGGEEGRGWRVESGGEGQRVESGREGKGRCTTSTCPIIVCKGGEEGRGWRVGREDHREKREAEGEDRARRQKATGGEFRASYQAPVFGVPEENVPENLFLIFFPTPEGQEKKTLQNSNTATGLLSEFLFPSLHF